MLEVVLDICSGMPNPHWVLSDSQEEKFLSKVKAVTTPTLSKPSSVVPKLGYRGFIVRSSHCSGSGTSFFIHGGIVDFGQFRVNRKADNRDLERWLLDSAKSYISNSIRTEVNNELGKSSSILQTLALDPPQPQVDCLAGQAADAPAYNPGLWNNNPVTVSSNNCYNYANNYIDNLFAQPGYGRGGPGNLACPDCQQNATADGLVACNDVNNALRAGEGWYVALVINPGIDYHWYRQDNTGCWSHKQGCWPVTDRDNSGNVIADPQHCDLGAYVFCTYMIRPPGVAISGGGSPC